MTLCCVSPRGVQLCSVILFCGKPCKEVHPTEQKMGKNKPRSLIKGYVSGEFLPLVFSTERVFDISLSITFPAFSCLTLPFPPFPITIAFSDGI